MKIRRLNGGRLNIFSKTMIVIVFMLIPIFLMYQSSNKISTDVVERELLQVNLNRLSFFVDQMDAEVDRLWRSAFAVAADPDAVQLQFRSSSDPIYSLLMAKKLLQEKLNIQSLTFAWSNKFTVYSPLSDIWVSTNRAQQYDEAYFEEVIQDRWDYRLIVTERGQEKAFVRQLVSPFETTGRPQEINLYVEVTFSADNLSDMLDSFKQGSSGKPFLYHPGYEPIVATYSDKQLVQELIGELDHATFDSEEGSTEVSFRGEQYQINYATSVALGWYLVDFVPMEQVLHPIEQSKRMFYVAGLLLLVLGAAAAALLYRNVQKPIYDLIRAVRSLRRGEYGYRIERWPSNEFHFLIEQFNLMAHDIQTLIDKVYTEQLRAKESSLKHLQAQINPHFLYNNFAFIQSLAQLDRTKGIVAFTQHLSQYYRYTTRTEQQLTSLSEEMDLIRNYLEIHRMQSERLQYFEDIDEATMSLVMPRLLLQPIVENAIVHGMEGKKGEFRIAITGARNEDGFELTVEDNGTGLQPDKLEAVRRYLQLPASADHSLGLRNVHQRLKHYFGHNSGLRLDVSTMGGLKVTLIIDNGGDPDI